jgi:hypothetical protein
VFITFEHKALSWGISRKSALLLAEISIRKSHYIAFYWLIYHYAEAHGLREVNLGRGGAQTKRRLGADRFILLNNWL